MSTNHPIMSQQSLPLVFPQRRVLQIRKFVTSCHVEATSLALLRWLSHSVQIFLSVPAYRLTPLALRSLARIAGLFIYTCCTCTVYVCTPSSHHVHVSSLSYMIVGTASSTTRVFYFLGRSALRAASSESSNVTRTPGCAPEDDSLQRPSSLQLHSTPH